MMTALDFWPPLLNELRNGRSVMLLTVVESIGSSPGRAGFKLYVTDDGLIHGSIGGGTMEHKLVELARSIMAAGSPSGDPAGTMVAEDPADTRMLKRQIHRPNEAKDRSGMICSGEQTVAFTALLPIHAPVLERIVDRLLRGQATAVVITDDGIAVDEDPTAASPQWISAAADGWRYRERLDRPPRIVIIGGGHVSLALSRTMKQLGFHVRVIDDREELNTMATNTWADQCDVIPYDRIGEALPEDPELCVALVSHGYRTDGIVLRQVVRRKFKYLGMLGSVEKVKRMFEEMKRDGFTQEELGRVHAPIGLPIHSRTPEEIAVSIAAEIVRVKNVRSASPAKRDPATA